MIDRENILIVGPSWVGDMVMAQALFKVIKARHDNVHIDVLAPAWSHPILERMPEVNEAFVMPVGHGKLQLKTRYVLAKKLRLNAYDQAFILPNSFKSALIPFLSRIALRTGWLGEVRWGLVNDIRYLNKKRYPLMVQRYLALGFKRGEPFNHQDYYPHLVVNENKCQAALQKYKLVTDRPVLMLCPGAQYGASKRWPEEYYAKVATQFIAKGGQVWLMGGKGEKPTIRIIQHLCQNQCEELSDTTLAEAIDLMSLVDTVISNDSGMMHIAAALDKRLIAIFGSSSPDFTPPLSKKAKVLSLEMSCKPCFKRECPLKHHKCMREITPEQVLALL